MKFEAIIVGRPWTIEADTMVIAVEIAKTIESQVIQTALPGDVAKYQLKAVADDETKL